MTAHLRDREYLLKMRELREKFPGRFLVFHSPSKKKPENEKPQKYTGVIHE